MIGNSSSIKSNMLWNSLGNIVYLFSQWLLTYFVVRILGYSQAGVFSLAMTIGGSLVSIALYSVRNYQVSDIQDQFSDKTYFVARIFTCILSLSICLVFIIVNHYPLETTLCIIVYMVFKVSEALSDVYQGFLQKEMRLDYVGRSYLLKGIIEIIVFFVLLFTTCSLLLSVLSLCIVSFTLVFIYDMRKALLIKQGEDSVFSFAQVRSLLVTCLPLAIFGLLFNTIGQAPRYFLEAQLGANALGVYASIAMPVLIIQVSASFIFAPLTTPLATHLQKGDLENFNKLIGKVLLVLAVFSVVAIFGFLVLGNWFLSLLFGQSIEDYQFLMMPLVICSVLVAFSWFLSMVLVVIRRLKPLLVISAISFATVLVASVPFIQKLGMNGASFSMIFALALFILGCAFVLCKDYSWRKQI